MAHLNIARQFICPAKTPADGKLSRHLFGRLKSALVCEEKVVLDISYHALSCHECTRQHSLPFIIIVFQNDHASLRYELYMGFIHLFIMHSHRGPKGRVVDGGALVFCYGIFTYIWLRLWLSLLWFIEVTRHYNVYYGLIEIHPI